MLSYLRRKIVQRGWAAEGEAEDKPWRPWGEMGGDVCSPLWSVFRAQSWRRGSEGFSSPGQTMRGWTAAVATKEPLGRGTVYLVSGLTPGPLAAGTDADPTR